MLRRNHSAKNAPRPGPLRVLPPAGASPAGNARSCRNIPASPPLCRRKRPVRRSAGENARFAALPEDRYAPAFRREMPLPGPCASPGRGERARHRAMENAAPARRPFSKAPDTTKGEASLPPFFRRYVSAGFPPAETPYYQNAWPMENSKRPLLRRVPSAFSESG